MRTRHDVYLLDISSRISLWNMFCKADIQVVLPPDMMARSGIRYKPIAFLEAETDTVTKNIPNFHRLILQESYIAFQRIVSSSKIMQNL